MRAPSSRVGMTPRPLPLPLLLRHKGPGPRPRRAAPVASVFLPTRRPHEGSSVSGGVGGLPRHCRPNEYGPGGGATQWKFADAALAKSPFWIRYFLRFSQVTRVLTSGSSMRLFQSDVLSRCSDLRAWRALSYQLDVTLISRPVWSISRMLLSHPLIISSPVTNEAFYLWNSFPTIYCPIPASLTIHLLLLCFNNQKLKIV